MSIAYKTSQEDLRVPRVPEEQIFVIPRTALFHECYWQGLFCPKNADEYISLFKTVGTFENRPAMEEDIRYKQIIPYVLFCHDNQYFLMQRSDKANEQRLKSKKTLGIGGHLREEDVDTSSSVLEWARREFEEEVSYNGSLQMRLIGIINDDTTPVNQVHMGLLILAVGDSSDIEVKSELQSGKLVSLTEIEENYDALEKWSQIAFSYLKTLSL